MEEFVVDIREVFHVLTQPIFTINNAKISITNLLISILIIFLALKLSRVLGRLANRALDRRSVDSGVRDSIERVIRYVVVIIGILFALDNLGFSINSLAAVGAVLMVGIGFGLQNITQNFISGIILLIERPIKVGDNIQVGSYAGHVIDIRVRSTVVQTNDDAMIIIPNSKLISEEVINNTFGDPKTRHHIKVGVAYGTDTEKVKNLLLERAMAHEEVCEEPNPQVIFENFGASSLDFDLQIWCDDMRNVDKICSDIRYDINACFAREGIEIPFPQQVVHTVSPKK